MCLLCLKKCLRQLTTFQADRICQLYKTKINISDSWVTQGLSILCRTTLRRKQEGKEVALSPLLDFKSIQVRPETRSTMCYCLICYIGHSKLQEKHPLKEQTTIEKEPSVRCSTCLSPLGKGLLHQCSQIKDRENLQSLAAKDAKVAEQITSRVISNKELSQEGTIPLAKASGRPPLTITPSKYLYLNNFCIYILKESLYY